MRFADWLVDMHVEIRSLCLLSSNRCFRMAFDVVVFHTGREKRKAFRFTVSSYSYANDEKGRELLQLFLAWLKNLPQEKRRASLAYVRWCMLWNHEGRETLNFYVNLRFCRFRVLLLVDYVKYSFIHLCRGYKLI